MKPLGMVIVGAGRISGAHAAAIAANPATLTLAGVVSQDAPRATRLLGTTGARHFATLEAALADPAVDAVVIGLPNVDHARAALDCLRAGKHVLVEKPMALDLRECDAMIEAARGAGLTLMVGQTQHFFPMNVKAHALLTGGSLGPIAALTDTWYKPFGLAVRRPWFLDRAQGGGMWMMNGNHMIDRMVWFSGSNVVRVKARVGNELLGQKADDNFQVLLEHDNGLHSLLVHGGYQVGEERWIGEALCEKGMLKLSTFAPNQGLWVARADRYEEVPWQEGAGGLPADVAAMNAEFAAFGRAALHREPEAVTPEHARHLVAVLLAAEESARTRREVAVSR